MMHPDKDQEVSSTESSSNAPRRFRLSQPLSETPQYVWIGPKTEIIVYLDAGKPRAFHSICPHMGAKMERDTSGQKLHCPWHGLAFSTQTLTSEHHRYKKICEVKVEMQGDELVVLGVMNADRGNA